MPQSAVQEDTAFIVSPDCKATILFDESCVDEWVSALENQDHIVDVYIVTARRNIFDEIKTKAATVLGPVTVAEPEERAMSKGFAENLEYFRLDFLEPAEVARGDAFQAILPILWTIAGGVGPREECKGSQAWFIPKKSPFAVLLKEKEFTAFRTKLAERQDIRWVFLVTDSEENFATMRRKLGHRIECMQLYKSYLETFRLNTNELVSRL